MSVAELALLITTLSGAVVALLGVRSNAAKLTELQDKLKDAEHDATNNRKDIILIGEQLSGTRQDISKLVLLVNQIYIDYMNETGQKPKINWEIFDQFMMVKHVTTPLGPLQMKE
jgi:hypothetical protein